MSAMVSPWEKMIVPNTAGTSDEDGTSSSEDGSEGPSRKVIDSEADGLMSEGESSQVSIDKPVSKCDKCTNFNVILLIRENNVKRGGWLIMHHVVAWVSLEVASPFLRGRGKAGNILPSSDPTLALLLVGFTEYHDDDDDDNDDELGIKLSALERKYDLIFIHNQKLNVDISKCTEANMVLKNHEKEFKTIFETLKEDHSEIKKTVSRIKTAINNYITMLEETKKELACAKCENEAIQVRLDSFSNSQYLLDHIIRIQKEKKDVKCNGYNKCHPSVRHNFTKMPDEEDMPRFEPSVTLNIEEFAVGLGYKNDISSNQAQPADVKDSTTVQNQDPPVIVEDCDSSDDESNEDEARQSNTVTK
ncbi:hypothetical protein Hanom_Chr04g00309831 [Helianthus anomalus]